jgi:hypothetical protein
MTATKIKRELKRLHRETSDGRFADAIKAIEERFGAAKRGRPKEWSEFELTVLWVLVQARVRAFKITISAACKYLAEHPHLLPVKRRSVAAGTLERIYHTDAVTFLDGDSEEFRWADADANALARILKEQRAPPGNRQPAS